jgi:hypothetical protein
LVAGFVWIVVGLGGLALGIFLRPTAFALRGEAEFLAVFWLFPAVSVGLGQWLVLRHYLSVSVVWVPATILGFLALAPWSAFLLFGLGAYLVVNQPSPLIAVFAVLVRAAIPGLVFGGLYSVLQFLVIQKQLPGGRWIWFSSAGFCLGGIIGLLIFHLALPVPAAGENSETALSIPTLVGPLVGAWLAQAYLLYRIFERASGNTRGS